MSYVRLTCFLLPNFDVKLVVRTKRFGNKYSRSEKNENKDQGLN